VINFLAVVEGPRQWTAPAWMAGAEPGAHLEAFAGWHPAVSEMVGAVPQSPRWGRTRQVQAASWATSAVLHLPDGPAAQVRDAYLASLPERLAWIHGYDILAQSPDESGERRQNPARSQGGSR
jgi:hypothetical protein